MTSLDEREGVLRVLATGERTTSRPTPGEVHALRLADGGCLPGLVLHRYDSGLYAGATVLWVLAPRQRGPVVDLASLSAVRPLLPPLIVHRELWSQGVAALSGRLAQDHPLLRQRVVFTRSAGGRCYDLAERPVEHPERTDVMGKDGLVFLKGLDQRLRRLISVGR